eukprot:CAMPEP_0197068320 /NCGR_PEP_ID=MMETSP1384-20130603/185889_1 /TAXON_ID=29189 /ORGANISM="Ammonia sp." /LENGTH=47 /DNA_ID= /DNA_START= /DNA_END= /DNA_ORIENTATION=
MSAGPTLLGHEEETHHFRGTTSLIPDMDEEDDLLLLDIFDDDLNFHE